jgi:hypothetical protein
MGADNIGDWHQRWHARLSDARANEQPVAAWVDPRRPSQAVLERRVRWGLALFRVPFAVLFTAVGVGAALIFGFALLGLPTRRRQLSSSAARSSKSAAATGASAGREAAVAQRPGGRDLPPLPPGVRGVLQGPGARLHFVRRWPQVGAAVLVLGVLAWLLASLGGGASGPVGLVLRALSAPRGWHWRCTWPPCAGRGVSTRARWRSTAGRGCATSGCAWIGVTCVRCRTSWSIRPAPTAGRWSNTAGCWPIRPAARSSP